MPSVRTSGIFDGGDVSEEFDVVVVVVLVFVDDDEGAKIIFIPFLFKVFKSIVYDGGRVACR